MKTRTVLFLLLILGVQYINAQQIESSEFMVKNPEQTFVGAIMEANSINNDTHQFINAPLNPVDISYSLPITNPVQVLTPSYENMINAIRERLETNHISKPSLSFSFAVNNLQSPGEIASILGQNINPDFYFGTTQKTKKTLAAIYISQSLFSVDMDIFEDVCSDEKVLARGDELIIIGSVVFGRQALVLVESDYDYPEIRMAINELLSNTQNLSTEMISKDKAIITNSTIRIMLPGNETMEVTDPSNPLSDVKAYINKGISAEDFGKPIKFNAMHLKSRAVFVNKYKIN